MIDLPEVFLEQMHGLMGEEYAALLGCYASPPVSGLRVNTLKLRASELLHRLPYDLKPVAWAGDGFWFNHTPDDEDLGALGRRPYHVAGLYYLQEPSAMLPAQALAPQPGERVLDLCAAPGGKATQLASLMNDQGLLVANEIHPRRVWELAENLERWGVHNTVILNETPVRLAEYFGAFFDKVLVDAPCSGEGMFRKSEAARQEWSPGLVQSCAIRQSAILEEAIQLVRPGGCLVYSTCTFNPKENEAVVGGLLRKHTQFKLEEIVSFSGRSPGRPDWVGDCADSPEFNKAVRLWPHLAPGEGHFVALLRCHDAPEGLFADGEQKLSDRINKRGKQNLPLPAVYLQSFEGFSRDNLQNAAFDPSRLAVAGSYLYKLPELSPNLTGLRAIHPGWWLGGFRLNQERKVGRFEPSHGLALGLEATQAQRVLNMEIDNPRLLAYLRGEVLHDPGENGWVLAAVDGYPLGWGKRVQGIVKNNFPHGLRFR
jgi:NOL1/NOP2/sun family putative RNA methylase